MKWGIGLIERLQLFRNVGQFDSVASGATIALAPLTLIYAENGRGKTTLAAILRSLNDGDPLSIMERRRLSAQNPPHIVIEGRGGPPPAVFQNGAWSRTLPDIVVFDDAFVDQNVYSGLAVEPEHRQRLHELILGAQGVALNRTLQEAVARVEEQNRVLRNATDAIPERIRGALTTDAFCALANRDDIDQAITEAERSLAAAQEQDNVQRTSAFEALELPEFDDQALRQLLGRALVDVDAAALAMVQRHFARIGLGGENWVEAGIHRIYSVDERDQCPFCAQSLGGSEIIAQYRAYFSEGYAALKLEIEEASRSLSNIHGGEAQTRFERAVRTVTERRQFWTRFSEVPEVLVDTAAVADAWTALRNTALAALTQKAAAPLERIAIAPALLTALDQYNQFRSQIARLNVALQGSNPGIAIIKERTATANIAAMTADLNRLRVVKSRHTPQNVALCDAYLQAKAAKTRAENERDAAREALDRHRATAFPAYQTAINLYLQRFNAGFRLDQVSSTNIRGGSSCTYDVIVDNRAVSVGAGNVPAGSPSFRTVLSAGDRNTLALAFFFASLDQDVSRANKIVVIDDPITSLDEHRALTTVQEMRRLTDQVSQVIVLSHNKPFLCGIWEGMDTNRRTALEVVRDGAGSTIRAWDVNRDCITEHDKRHELLRDYLAQATPNGREVAQALRPTLEAFLRVAYPETFPPGRMLGPFRGICEQRVGTPDHILLQQDIDELRDLTEYANRFHHDTNPVWQTAVVNDAELLNFVRRTLTFARRR